MRSASLLRVLLLTAGTALLFGIALAGIWGFRDYRISERQQTIQDLSRLAPLATQLMENYDTLTEQCQLVANAVDARVTILNYGGDVVADSHFQQTSSLALGQTPDLESARNGDVGVHIYVDERLGTTVVSASARMQQPTPSTYYVRLSRPETDVWRQLDSYLVYVMVPGSIILAAAIASLLLFAARIRRNIRILKLELERKLRSNHPGLETTPLALDVKEFQSFADESAALQKELEDARDEIRRRNAQWQAIFANMAEAIIVVDDDDSIPLTNSAAIATFRIPDDLTKPGANFHAAVRHAKLYELVKSVRDSGQGHDAKLTISHPSSMTRSFLASAIRFTYRDDGLPSTLVVLTDVTRMRQLERMREEFVANVSHELKTPLTAVKGYIENLEDCLDDPEIAHRFLETAARHANRMNAIIDDLLYLSRLEQGDLTEHAAFHDGDLQNLAEKCLRTRAPLAADKEITLGIEVPPLHLTADFSLLEQAVDNLLTNAIKYSSPGDTVTIFADQNQDETIIGIRDNGPGIPSEHLDRIFERFYRVDKSRDRNTGGTGLGLSIVKHIALVHDGEVTVDSTVGIGTTFTIRLPRNSDQ